MRRSELRSHAQSSTYVWVEVTRQTVLVHHKFVFLPGSDCCAWKFRSTSRHIRTDTSPQPSAAPFARDTKSRWTLGPKVENTHLAFALQQRQSENRHVVCVMTCSRPWIKWRKACYFSRVISDSAHLDSGVEGESSRRTMFDVHANSGVPPVPGETGNDIDTTVSSEPRFTHRMLASVRGCPMCVFTKRPQPHEDPTCVLESTAVEYLPE